jgi:uncharacterized protein (DUF2461 family)
MAFTPAALRFFKDLRRHNNKPWFEACTRNVLFSRLSCHTPEESG